MGDLSKATSTPFVSYLQNRKYLYNKSHYDMSLPYTDEGVHLYISIMYYMMSNAESSKLINVTFSKYVHLHNSIY